MSAHDSMGVVFQLIALSSAVALMVFVIVQLATRNHRSGRGEDRSQEEKKRRRPRR